MNVEIDINNSSLLQLYYHLHVTKNSHRRPRRFSDLIIYYGGEGGPDPGKKTRVDIEDEEV